MPIYVCERCGIEFEQIGAPAKRCPDCRTKCANCGAPVSNHQRYCGKCRYRIKGIKHKKIKCKHPECDRMIRYDSRRSGYCWEHTDWSKHRERIIEYNKTVKKKPEHLHRRAQDDYTVDCVCKVCGKPFKARLGTVKYNPDQDGFCCSPHCVGVWAAKQTQKADTSIERAIEKAMIHRGWHYEKQVPLYGITLADFVLPYHKIVIYCDGMYWHSFPERQKQDAEQNRILESHGYKVYRFSGDEIRDSPQRCLDQIGIPQGSVFHQLRLPIFE